VVCDPAAGTYTRAEFIGTTTNNVAEYKGVLLALRLLRERGSCEQQIILQTDSSLIYNQLCGSYKVKDVNLRELAKQALSEMAEFSNLRLMLVPREENTAADAEVNAALDAQSRLSR
jgi:ribonuclease HI